MEKFIDIAYLIAAIFFIYGLKMLSHPKTARNGNMIASIGMLIAIIATVFLGTDLNFKMIDYGFNFEKKTDFSKNIINVSYRIFFIYLSLTIIIFLLFILSDVRIFNSLNLSMTIISSGGFLPTNSLDDILKTNLHHIVLILGFLISIFNFYLLYNLFFNRNNLKEHGEDFYILILLLSP